MMIDVNEVQLRKAKGSMFLIEFGKVTVVRSVHPANAASYIHVTEYSLLSLTTIAGILKDDVSTDPVTATSVSEIIL